MEIEKLRIFINLYETKNYTRTAQNLKMTQPGVSYNINAIENEVGQKLFVRNKRSVVPTKNAQIFYEHIKPLINEYYTAVQSIQDNESNLDNSINIGYSFTPYIQKYLPIWIKAFKEINPQVNIMVTNVNHNQLKQYLENNNIDIFLTSDGDAADLHNIRFTTIKKDKFHAIIPRKNTLAQKKALSLTDFNKQNLIFIDNNWTGPEMVSLQNKIIELNKQIKVTYTNDVSAATILVNSLNGITLGLNFIYLDNNSNLISIPIKEAGYIKYGIVSSKANEKKIVNKFINLVVSCNAK